MAKHIIKLQLREEGQKMEMTFRWFGSAHDTVTLKQIRQIPGVTGVITTLYNKMPGELWTQEEIHALKEEVEASGLKIAGIESVNIHDDIKTGSGNRDLYIENYIKTLENLGKEDIHMVCYNFMPVFDWTRTELARKRPDGSTVLAYTKAAIDALDPESMFDSINKDSNGAILPGWEPERMAKVKELFEMYKDVTDDANPIKNGGESLLVGLSTGSGSYYALANTNNSTGDQKFKISDYITNDNKDQLSQQTNKTKYKINL